MNNTTTQQNYLDIVNNYINNNNNNKSKSINHAGFNINTLKKGMVLLTKNGIVDTLTNEEKEIIETNEFNYRANRAMNEIVNRYLQRKAEEFELDGYTNDEIEYMIEEIINIDDEEYYDDDSENEEDEESLSDDDYY